MPVVKPVIQALKCLPPLTWPIIYPFGVVNRIRTQNGMTPLELITIDLIEITLPTGATAKPDATGAKTYSSEVLTEAKLSSTLLRSFITKE